MAAPGAGVGFSWSVGVGVGAEVGAEGAPGVVLESVLASALGSGKPAGSTPKPATYRHITSLRLRSVLSTGIVTAPPSSVSTTIQNRLLVLVLVSVLASALESVPVRSMSRSRSWKRCWTWSRSWKRCWSRSRKRCWSGAGVGSQMLEAKPKYLRNDLNQAPGPGPWAPGPSHPFHPQCTCPEVGGPKSDPKVFHRNPILGAPGPKTANFSVFLAPRGI